MDRRTFMVVAFVFACLATGSSAQGPLAFPGSSTAGSISSETKEKEIRSESGQSAVIDRQQIFHRLEVNWSVDDKRLDPDRDPITLSAPQHPRSNPAHESHADCGPACNVYRDPVPGSAE